VDDSIDREPERLAVMRYDSAPARRSFIMDMVRNTGFCSAAELSRDLGVSEMTVRRDI
jgi:DeoR/GlpR family transcriptional regulator of sugar metabolism